MKILILEDSVERTKVFKNRYKDHDLHIFSNYLIAKDMLMNHSPYDLVSLDHDLCEDPSNVKQYNNLMYSFNDEYTGYNLVEDICELKDNLRPPQIIIHSWNTPAAKRMKEKLAECGISSIFERFQV